MSSTRNGFILDGRDLIEGEPDFERLHGAISALYKVVDESSASVKQMNNLEFVRSFLDGTRASTGLGAAVSRYMRLPYTVHIVRDSYGDVKAKVAELPGCISYGNTTEEALTNVRKTQRQHLQAYLEQGVDPPRPARAAKAA